MKLSQIFGFGGGFLWFGFFLFFLFKALQQLWDSDTEFWDT